MTDKNLDRNFDLKEFVVIFFMASAFGTTTLLISELSRVLFNVPLCLHPISIKNILKTCLLNGGTITGIVLIADAFGITEKEIKEDLGLDTEEKDEK